jgi:hypothetical protein
MGKFVGYFFGHRRKGPIPTPPDSPVQWQAGDIAVCVTTGTWRSKITYEAVDGPAFGEMNRVAAVNLYDGSQMLRFNRYPNIGYAAYLFHKLQPKADEASGASSEFIKQIKKPELIDA